MKTIEICVATRAEALAFCSNLEVIKEMKELSMLNLSLY